MNDPVVDYAIKFAEDIERTATKLRARAEAPDGLLTISTAEADAAIVILLGLAGAYGKVSGHTVSTLVDVLRAAWSRPGLGQPVWR